MNANAIVSGEIYACTDYISRNKPFYGDAYPVKAVWVFPERLYGKSRDTWMVEVIVLNDDEDLTHQTTYDGADRTKKVRARDLYTRWEDHAGERELRRQQRIKDEELYQERLCKQRQEYEDRRAAEQRAYEQREKERELQRIKDEAEKVRLLKYMAMRGIPADCVVSIVNGTITLDRIKTQKALGMKELANG